MPFFSFNVIQRNTTVPWIWECIPEQQEWGPLELSTKGWIQGAGSTNLEKKKVVAPKKLKINSHLSPPRLEKTPLEHSALESPQQNRGQWWPWWWWRWWRQSLRRKIGWWWEGSADSWSLWGRWRWGRSRWRASSSWKIHWACTGNLRTIKLYNVYVDSTV